MEPDRSAAQALRVATSGDGVLQRMPMPSEAAFESARQDLPPDDRRPPAAFGPSVAVADDEPAHRLAAFMGGTP